MVYLAWLSYKEVRDYDTKYIACSCKIYLLCKMYLLDAYYTTKRLLYKGCKKFKLILMFEMRITCQLEVVLHKRMAQET